MMKYLRGLFTNFIPHIPSNFKLLIEELVWQAFFAVWKPGINQNVSSV